MGYPETSGKLSVTSSVSPVFVSSVSSSLLLQAINTKSVRHNVEKIE